jgi:hypothetical protein
MFWCENGPCIINSLRCNGQVDCPFDDSDELDCRKWFEQYSACVREFNASNAFKYNCIKQIKNLIAAEMRQTYDN